MISHFLIGIPASGKSTFAQQLATITQGKIISTDAIRQELYGDETIQGNWENIEAEVIRQIQEATAQNQPIIYDATNAKRAWRMAMLLKLSQREPLQNIDWMAWYLKPNLATCLLRNRERERIVPREVIEDMYDALSRFPPIPAEGFIAVEILKEAHWNLEIIQAILDKLPRCIVNRQNRTQHPNTCFHAYSQLLDFDRLMHLISLMIQYPGVGNLSYEQLAEIFAHIPEFDDELSEINAVMAKLRGTIYADPQAIAKDLQWLTSQGIVHEGKLIGEDTANLPQISIEPQKYEELNVHTYSEVESFERLMTIIRFILRHPFLPLEQDNLDKPKKPLDVLAETLSCQPGIIGNCRQILRKDIERVLKPYQILPPYPMRKGYFAGTAIFSPFELRQIAQLLQSQVKTIDDPLALRTYQCFQERMGWSRLETETAYPLRRIANRSMIDTESLSSNILSKQIESLESIIEEGELVEIVRSNKAGKFKGDEEDIFQAWLLQLVFYNFAWYVGLEMKSSGLLRFERLDRLTINYQTQQKRGRAKQEQTLKKLEKLLEACPGIHLGFDAMEQRQYLSPIVKERQGVEMTLKLWCTEAIFRFISEGTKRFSPKKMKMSRPNDQRQHNLKSLFCLDLSGDEQFPYQFQVILPKWSLDDVDLWRWLIGFGEHIKIIEPIELKEKVLETAQNIQAIYQT